MIVQLANDLKVSFPINEAGKQNQHAGYMSAQRGTGYHRILNVPLIGSARAGRTVPRIYLQGRVPLRDETLLVTDYD